ncbi:MAG: hypothetical protein IPK63_08600 [Candidatus Competibacteraceae bacterium]|nr:hypothetical protein [Candidatus Competibacteraceae bacterium]
MKKDKHGNSCNKLLPVNIFTLAAVKFDYNKSITFAEKLYGSNGIYFDIRQQLCLALTETQQTKLAVIDGQCKWDQNNAEQDDLFELVKGRVGAGISIFIVGGINTDGKTTLAGCAGHSPSKPAAVVSATGTMYTLAHELGHVLLTSTFSPVHETSNSNIMVNGTHNIPADSFPTFNATQIKQILKSTHLKDC